MLFAWAGELRDTSAWTSLDPSTGLSHCNGTVSGSLMRITAHSSKQQKALSCIIEHNELFHCLWYQGQNTLLKQITPGLIHTLGKHADHIFSPIRHIYFNVLLNCLWVDHRQCVQEPQGLKRRQNCQNLNMVCSNNELLPNEDCRSLLALTTGTITS